MNTLELYAVADTRDSFYGSPAEYQREIELAVDRVSVQYQQQLDTTVKLVGIEFTNGLSDTPLTVESVQARPRHDADVVVMFTTRKVATAESYHAMLATQVGLCDPDAVAVVQLMSDQLDGFTLSHALGHTAGFGHDAERGYVMSERREAEYISPASVARFNEQSHACLQATVAAPQPQPPDEGGSGGGGATGVELVALLTALCIYRRMRVST